LHPNFSFFAKKEKQKERIFCASRAKNPVFFATFFLQKESRYPRMENFWLKQVKFLLCEGTPGMSLSICIPSTACWTGQ
jgi:hypothetical protein